MTDPVTLLLGDCLEVMPTLEAESVDAVITDPPYGLGFMGKHWDHGVPAIEFWQQMHRVAKPGAYLLAFGGTRTVHRIATNIEDAGWIIRDMLTWIYASGFPKGRANLKPAHEPIVLARKPGPLRPLGIDECRIGTGDDGHGGGRYGSSGFVSGYQRTDQAPSDGQAGEGGDGFGAEVVGAASVGQADGERTDGSPATGFVASGVGRWPSNVLLQDADLFDRANPFVIGSGAVSVTGDVRPYERANLDGFAGPMPEHSAFERAGDSGGYSRFFLVPKAGREERERGLAGGRVAAEWGGTMQSRRPHTPPDYQYQPKARANVHPTVKPIVLMRHLVRLVTPPGGVVLDPFLGSGTTCLAASEEGFRCIGIEREAEYLEIARGRLAATKIGMGL